MKFLQKHCSQCQAYKKRADTYNGMIEGEDNDEAANCLADGCRYNNIAITSTTMTATETTDVVETLKEGKNIQYNDKCC